MKGVWKTLVLSGVIFFSFGLTSGQKLTYKKYITRNKLGLNQAHLISKYGKKKSLTEKYNLQCLYTLSYFNELKDTKIVFAHKKIKTTMVCRPRWDFVFRKKESRTYKIIFNSDTLNTGKVTFDQLSFNAQIGVLGHEYSHILDYKERTNRNLIKFGLLYLTHKKFKETLEKRVDKIAISKGLGWQVYDFSRYVLNESSADEEYKKYKATFYYTPTEINDMIDVSYPEENPVLKN